MGAWWEGLDMLSKVLYCIAIPSSLVLVVQIIMSLAGFFDTGGGIDVSDTSGLDGSFDPGAEIDIDIDPGADGGNPSDFGTLNFFTVQGIVTFLAVFSWSAIALSHAGVLGGLAAAIGFVLGVAAMYGVAKILQLSARLAENGTLDKKNAIGATGSVYLKIPAECGGEGKINVTVQGRFVEASAITEGDALPTGTAVRITDLRNGVFVVERDS